MDIHLDLLRFTFRSVIKLVFIKLQVLDEGK